MARLARTPPRYADVKNVVASGQPPDTITKRPERAERQTTMAMHNQNEAPRVSPFASLGGSVNELNEVRETIQALADLLTGPAPKEVSGGAQRDKRGGPGLIDGIEYASDAIGEMVSDMRNNLRRIERRI